MARFTVYLPDEQMALIKERADAVGISVSKYARLATVQRASINKLRADEGRRLGREKW